MASRFQGRDFITLRTEIIDFFRSRFPSDWDSENISDPMVILAESLAKMGDQLHYTIDELRRECDISTAQRRSSVYSYALREGYTMLLPRGSFCNVYLEKTDSAPDASPVLFDMSMFDEVKLKNSSLKLYSSGDYSKVLSKTGTKEAASQYVRLVLGEKKTFNFSFSDISYYSTVELPEPYIDRDLVSLTVTGTGAGTWNKVDDVVSSGMAGNIYSLTPTFVGGNIVLNIEFPFNYKTYFDSTTRFTFTYLKVSDVKVPDTSELDFSDYVTADDPEYFNYRMGSGVQGYKGYEDPETVKVNYKNFVKDYSSLLTKSDYEKYMKFIYASRVSVFDKSDEFYGSMFALSTRSIYIATDAGRIQRNNFHVDLKERSARSDLVWMFPYGYYPYLIVILAKSDLLGVTATEVESAIESKLLEYYSDSMEVKEPISSYIDYLCHASSDNVKSVEIKIFLDPYYGKEIPSSHQITYPANKAQAISWFNQFGPLSSDVRFKYQNYAYVAPTTVPSQVKFSSLEEAYSKNSDLSYDSDLYDEQEIIDMSGSVPKIDTQYALNHYLVPQISRVIVWAVTENESVT